MNHVIQAFKPNSIAERYLLESIVKGVYPPGSSLPSERALAEVIGVTRTTLREVISRLARDGWITVRHGQATKVNDYHDKVGLSAIDILLTLEPDNAPEMVEDLFYFRIMMSPNFIRQSIKNSPREVEVKLADIYSTLKVLRGVLELGKGCNDSSQVSERHAVLINTPLWNLYRVDFHWSTVDLQEISVLSMALIYASWCEYHLFQQLTRLSKNSVWTMAFNSMREFYLRVGCYYFQVTGTVAHLMGFVESLLVGLLEPAFDVRACVSDYDRATKVFWAEKAGEFYENGLSYDRG
ncbi:fatty acid metabolism transcriptional regulator FadR [Vibrio sp. PNB22_3_1]